jgi:molecular chaperone DnaJ
LTCPECSGAGVVETRTINVRFPPGLVDGQRIRFRGRGKPGEGGAGDLVFIVKVRPDRCSPATATISK